VTALHDALGIVTRTGDAYQLVFERRLAQPPEKVWAALTAPERISAWLAEAEVDLRIGGAFRLRFTDPDYEFEGVITELESPRLIAWTWPHAEHPHSVVRWELFPEGAGCRLVLTQTNMHPPHLAEVAAGWHALLECLPGAAGGPVVIWRAEREREIGKLYAGLPGD
jgi:uncharacterized protein YndB with AHSA1/START domain